MIYVGTITSLASLAVSIASAFIAKSALVQAKLAVEEQRRSVQEQKLANEQAHADWAQRKWFDLYFKADQACNSLERFQATYEKANPATPSLEQMKDHNAIMYIFREVITMATVFPKNPVLDELFAAMDFKIPGSALSKDRLKSLASALESLRQKALVNRRVLDILTNS